MRRYPELEAGFLNYSCLVDITLQLYQAVRSANTPFGLDVAGAARLFKAIDIDPDDDPRIDLDLWAEEVGATEGEPQPYRGRICRAGEIVYSRLVSQIASSLVLVAESTPNFPYNDAKMARRLLHFMGVDVTTVGDVDLDKIARQRESM